MSRVTLYSGSIGINNRVPAHRLPFDPKTGVTALESAENVIIDRTGQVVSRRGFSLDIAGSFHSLFPGKKWGLAAKDRDNDTALYVVEVNDGSLSLTGIRSGFTKGLRFDYCQNGGVVYYSNGRGYGRIIDRDHHDWPVSVWDDAETNVGFEQPPPMDHLCYLAGRIYFSIGSALRFTEFARHGLYDPATNGENFNSRIIMLVAVSDGIYVSTENNIHFLAGLDPTQWTATKALNFPALEWAKHHEYVSPKYFGIEGPGFSSVVIGTKRGPVLLMPGGQTVTMVDHNLSLQDCDNDSGSIVVVDDSLIIQSME